MDYEQLLQRARQKMPSSVFERQRFEIPKVVGHLEGNKTIISNFLQIASTIRRTPDHLHKFLLHELAAPGELRGNLLVIGTKIAASRINEKIRQYANQFVFCQKCGKPDTDLKKDHEFLFVVCSVCGERTAVQSKI